jgi:hypothetical protein
MFTKVSRFRLLLKKPLCALTLAHPFSLLLKDHMVLLVEGILTTQVVSYNTIFINTESNSLPFINKYI